jgi:hypothetical protein
MNANPTLGLANGTQLLTWARFADLRSSKSFSCIKLVEAGGVEFKSKSHNAPVFIDLQAVELFASADQLTFGPFQKVALLSSSAIHFSTNCHVAEPLVVIDSIGNNF